MHIDLCSYDDGGLTGIDNSISFKQSQAVDLKRRLVSVLS